MSRLLYQAELPRPSQSMPYGLRPLAPIAGTSIKLSLTLLRAPHRNRTGDLFLTMETLYRLS
jgi:hypothetical protein